MYKILLALLSVIICSQATCYVNSRITCSESSALSNDQLIVPQNNCISFSVGQGTGCAWMYSYCANSLGTNNYYFTDGVCSYQSGGCVGNPVAGKTYTCCSV
jgi:hypothetical protein